MTPHCWTPGPYEPDGMSTTCMLPDAHPGEHRFTRDSEISIHFGAAPVDLKTLKEEDE